MVKIYNKSDKMFQHLSKVWNLTKLGAATGKNDAVHLAENLEKNGYAACVVERELPPGLGLHGSTGTKPGTVFQVYRSAQKRTETRGSFGGKRSWDDGLAPGLARSPKKKAAFLAALKKSSNKPPGLNMVAEEPRAERDGRLYGYPEGVTIAQRDALLARLRREVEEEIAEEARRGKSKGAYGARKSVKRKVVRKVVRR